MKCDDAQKIEMLTGYIDKGIQLIKLHNINSKGACTCHKGVECTASGKHPVKNGWQNIREPVDIFVKHSKANVGIATGKCSGVFVLDVDPRHDGDKTLEKLIAENGALPTTPMVITGSGGSHYYFDIPIGEDIRCCNDLLPGIDIKGETGLVVAPPSVHASGNTYCWQEGQSIFDVALAQAPKWLLSIINAGKRNGRNKAKPLPEVILDGSRTTTFTSLAGTLRRRNVSEEGILAALRVENERCEPPLEDEVLSSIAKSMEKYEAPKLAPEWNEEARKNLNETVAGLKDYSKVFEPDIMAMMALAKRKSPSDYAAIKTQLKGKVNLNDLERVINYQSREKETKDSEFEVVLDLEGLDVFGYLVPRGWQVSFANGVTKTVSGRDGGTREVTACFAPVIISRRFHNIDSGIEKVELKFSRDGRWKTNLALRSVVFNRNGILKLADSGFPITSNNSGDLISYLSDFEQTNRANISIVQSVSRLGWIMGTEFFPFSVSDKFEFETDSKESATILEGLECLGDEMIWIETARKLRMNPAARFMLAASFASVLIEPLHKRVFLIHIWHISRSGKTGTLKFAISPWGDPSKLIGSFNSTIVGLERRAASLRNLPVPIRL